MNFQMPVLCCGQRSVQFKYPLQDNFSLSDEKDVQLM